MNLQVDYRPLSTLIPYARNVRTHTDAQVAQIAASIREFGWTNPILVDGQNGLIAGHGRLLAARVLGLDQVPCIELSHLSDAQRRAYILADNRLALNAGWDEELLALELAELQALQVELDLLGFEQDEISSLLATLDSPGLLPDADPDEIPEPPAVPITQPGDLILLGHHRLLCGDSLDPAAVERLLDGAKPQLLLTDPPYGVNLDMEWRDRAGKNKPGQAEPSYLKRTDGHTNTTISGDTKADWSDAFELVPSLDTAYVWHASTHSVEVALGLQRIGFEIKQQIIWVKPHFALSRQFYHWQHEPCWLARRGKALPFIGAHNQSTVWEAVSPKMLMNPGGSTEEKVDHPCQKPVALYTRPLENHLAVGECFYEPFAGSGTALMAAEQTGHVALCMELDPRYCDVIAARWEKCTGRQTERIPAAALSH